MYRTLNAEMGRQAMGKKDLAKVINKTPATLSQKINGNIVWSLPEAIAVRKALKCESMDLAELFRWGD